MEIKAGKVTLRDTRLPDIADEIRWMNTDTAWLTADTPWLTPEPADPDELRRDMLALISGLEEGGIRWRLEIEAEGHHIGFVSSYDLEEASGRTPSEPIDRDRNAAANRSVRALGIEICEPAWWGRGIGTTALAAFMDYCRRFGEDRFLLETWSGNARMLGCARKLGFTEVERKKTAYTVNGEPVEAIILECADGKACAVGQETGDPVLSPERNEHTGPKGGIPMKALVAYFSAGGVTAGLAARLAEAVNAALYEIRPAVPYTPADLDWRDRQSRSTLEMQDRSCRPALADTDAPVADAEVVFVGFPVWWYREPSVIDSFLAAYDFTGKRIVLFATSGGSGMGEEAPARAAEIAKAEVIAAKRFSPDVPAAELRAWAESL